jgi:WD40 repeat protein
MQTQYSAQGDGALIQAAALDYPRLVLTGEQDQISSVAYSPDGRYAATGGWDGTAILWDMRSGQIIRSFTGHSGKFWIRLSPDGLQVSLRATTDPVCGCLTGKELRYLAVTIPILVAFS